MDAHSHYIHTDTTTRVVYLVNSLGVDATYKGNIAIILYNNMYVEYSGRAFMFCSSVFCNLKIVGIWKTLNGFMATEYSKKQF